jgi:hypothetical protein
MSKKPVEKKQVLDKATINKIMRTVPKNEGMQFLKGPGEPTGKTATSLTDLAAKLASVDIRSVNYHFKRSEFEKWIRDSFDDQELARRFNRVNKETHGEKLREQLVMLIKNRIDELKAMAPA